MASRPVRFISGAGQSVVCPYDRSHIVQSNRLLRHLLKCRKNYTGPDLAVCRYSAVHIMRPEEIPLHEASCPYGPTSEPNVFTSETCVVCLENPPVSVVWPCRHCCLCRPCGRRLKVQSSTCPVCRQEYLSIF